MTKYYAKTRLVKHVYLVVFTFTYYRIFHCRYSSHNLPTNIVYMPCVPDLGYCFGRWHYIQILTELSGILEVLTGYIVYIDRIHPLL